MKKFEWLEHTADAKLRVYGASLRELFENAAVGMYDLATDFEAVREVFVQPGKKSEKVRFDLKSQNVQDLLLAWLRELLFYFSSKRFIFVEFDFETFTETHLKATLKGIIFDPEQFVQKDEIKAVTYHEAFLKKENQKWIAEIIFDI